jgi:hypothetical protein
LLEGPPAEEAKKGSCMAERYVFRRAELGIQEIGMICEKRRRIVFCEFAQQ